VVVVRYVSFPPAALAAFLETPELVDTITFEPEELRDVVFDGSGTVYAYLGEVAALGLLGELYIATPLVVARYECMAGPAIVGAISYPK